MLEYGTLRELFKSTNKVYSENVVIAEWNMNRYQTISSYGLYKGYATDTDSTVLTNVITGYNYLIYDDGTNRVSDNADSFSSLASVFKPDRPDAGIVLLNTKTNGLISYSPQVTMRASNITTSSPRFYPFSETRSYDYFDSSKNLFPTNPNPAAGTSDARNGDIQSANPFVIYSSSFPCNKIVIKVQKYASYPTNFVVQILPHGSNIWTNAYSGVSSTELQDGKLEIYYSAGTWSTTESNITDLGEITTQATQAIKIRGIRLKVSKVSLVGSIVDGVLKESNASLELIEISPRLQVDLSSFTESLTVNSSLGESEFGLPVGTVVKSDGSISFSNDTGAFLSSSTLASYNMLSPNVEFRIYQKVTASVSGDEASNTTYTIPIKTMYADKWDTGGDWTTAVDFSDRMRLFQEKTVIDLALITQNGTPMSVALLILLDNLGITGYEFKKTYSGAVGEDTLIKNFFCSKEQTLATILEELAVATQCTMYIDASNNLSVLTKEKIWQSTANTQSFSSLSAQTASTDFFFVGDEDYSGTGTESYLTNYVANILSLSESKIDPITDGEITYHSYGLRKERGAALLKQEVPKEYLEDVPFNSVIDAGYVYKGSILWSPGSDNESVLAAANLLKDISASRLKDVFSGEYIQYSEEDAIRAMFNEAKGKANVNKMLSLVMFLDRNDMYLFTNFSGYVFVDLEHIEYYGKVFNVNYPGEPDDSQVIVFSQEELNDIVNNAPLRSSVIPIGLVVKPKFKVERSNDKHKFTIIGDGRGALNSSNYIKTHAAFNENTSASEIVAAKRYKVGIGSKQNIGYVLGAGSGLKASTSYDFGNIKNFKKVKKLLANFPDLNDKTYLGTLKIAGPQAPARDLATLNSITGVGVVNEQNKINLAVDKIIPGSSSAASVSFDDFVYFWGEQNIYGQKLELPFSPRVIETRMRLFSGQKKVKNGKYVASTMSSIAGIAFGIGNNGTGYYLEVESIGSGKSELSPVSLSNNLRFYKVYTKQGILTVDVLKTAAVNVQTTLNSDVRLVTDSGEGKDEVFDLKIVINRSGDFFEYDIYYGNSKINNKPITEKVNDSLNINSNTISFFVRNDSQAIYEYIAAATTPAGQAPGNYFKSRQNIQTSVDTINRAKRGLLSTSTKELVEDKGNDLQVYFNDFARMVRETKKYTARFDAPVLSSRIIDISRVNPQYMVKYLKANAFGAEIQVTNTSGGAITLSEESNLPLYIFGIKLEELSTGNVNMQDISETDIEGNKRVTTLQKNKALYGEKGFSLDSRFIQSPSQARNLFRWISSAASKQRTCLELEVFTNPLLELGDKVKVVSKDRGYFENNTVFGNKTFVVSDISYSVSEGGPDMKIKLIEVGNK
jgi:hypothetical protein